MAFRFPHLRGVPDRARPGRDVFAALAIKGILLLAIYLLFFGPAHRPPSDSTATATALLGTNASKDAP
jgi:hypothetical protein